MELTTQSERTTGDRPRPNGVNHSKRAPPPAPDPQRTTAPRSRQAGGAPCPRQDRAMKGRSSNQTPGPTHAHRARYTDTEPHTPLRGEAWISQRGMGDGHTLPQGRTGSANQRPIRRSGWGQLAGVASGPRQLRKKPSRDAPCSPPYSCALRRTFIMADLLVDNRAPRSMCVRWRERATSRMHRPLAVGVAAALRCCTPRWGGMEGRPLPTGGSSTQRLAEGQSASGERQH